MGQVEDEIHEIRTCFLVQLDVFGKVPNELGITYRGRRRVVFLKGGTFTGPRLNGVIEEGGGDSALVRPDGVFEIDVRALLRCDDGALIYLLYQGLWHTRSPDVMDRLLKREGTLDFTEFYIRTTCKFETSHPDYLWLNRMMTIGMGYPKLGTDSGMTYQIHEVL